MTVDAVLVAIRAMRWHSRFISFVAVVLLLILPFVLFFAFSTDWRESLTSEYKDQWWSLALVQSSLQNGTIWLLPGHVIFQDNMELGGEDDALFATLMLVLLFLVPVALVISVTYRMLIFITKMMVFRFRLFGEKKTSSIDDKSLLGRLLPDAIDEKPYLLEGANIVFTGRSMIIQKSIKTSLPTLFFDATSNDIAKREGRRILFKDKDELVFDAVTFEHFRIYATERYHTQLTHFFSSEVLALIVKELDNADLILDNGVLTAVLDVRKIRSEKDIMLTLESMNRLHAIFGTASVNIANPSSTLTSPRIERTVRLFAVATMRYSWALVLMYAVVGVYIITAAAAGGDALVGDMVFPIWIAATFQIIGIHRVLKHKISLQPLKGVFVKERGLLWKLFIR